MSIAILTLQINLPECASLKDKRSHIKPLLSRLHREFNVSAAEIDHLDQWKSAVIACSVVSNDANHNYRLLQKIVVFIIDRWPDLTIIDHQIELI